MQEMDKSNKISIDKMDLDIILNQDGVTFEKEKFNTIIDTLDEQNGSSSLYQQNTQGKHITRV